MIGYYLWLKLKLVFSPRNNIWGFAALLLLIPLAILYGKGLATLMGGGFFELTGTMRHAFKIGLLGFIAALTFLRGFFPSYKPIRPHFRSFHPIPPVLRFMLNIFDDFISGYFIIMTSFIAAFFFFSTITGMEYLVYFIVALIGSHIFRRFFQTLLENKIQLDRPSPLMLFACICLVMLFAGLIFLKRVTIWGITGCFFLLLLGDFFLEELCPKERVESKSTGKTDRSIPADLLWHNNIGRTTLIVGVIFKVLILSSDLIIYLETGEHLAIGLFLVLLFISPVIPFTYLFNNTWGYFRNYWLITDRSFSTGRDLFGIYLEILWRPLAVDITISMAYLALTPSNFVLPAISMYATSLIVLTVGGFYWSCQVPIRVEKIIAFKANATTFGNIVSIGIVSSFLTLFFSGWFYLLVPIYIVLSLTILQWVIKNYPSKREHIYLKLYR